MGYLNRWMRSWQKNLFNYLFRMNLEQNELSMNQKGILLVLLLASGHLFAQTPAFNGIESGLNNLYRLSTARSRSISPENVNGEKGKGGMATSGTGSSASRDLGQGWKLSPSVVIKPHTVYTVAEIEGPGSVQHIWMTPTGNWRYSILRFYWDDEAAPSVEVPVGDFFGMGWGDRKSVV